MVDGLNHRVLRHVTATAVRIVVDYDVAGLKTFEAQLIDRPLDDESRRSDLCRVVLTLSDQFAVGIENHACEVTRLAEYGRIGRTHECSPHLGANVHQMVVDDAKRDAVDFHGCGEDQVGVSLAPLNQ